LLALDAPRLRGAITLGSKRMSSGAIIGALAFITIGLVLAVAIFHFGTYLRDPRNRGAAHKALVEDGSSAHTAVRGGSGHAEG
jgi:hypothetical protein